MAEIVGGFLIPHNPLMVVAPEAPGKPVAGQIKDIFAGIRRRIVELEADTVITIGADHYGVFGPSCIPAYHISIGDLEGPMEQWLGLERHQIAANGPLATHIFTTGRHAGIDWAFSTSLTVDHAAMVPVHLCVPSERNVRVIPIYLNVAVPPVLPSSRAWDIGESIRAAVGCWDKDERIVVLGTGGISHWVGAPEMGQINEEFDREVLELAIEGRIRELASIPDEQIIERAGNGAMEIKNWICGLATMPEARRTSLGYFAIPEWVSGVGFVEIEPLPAGSGSASAAEYKESVPL